jgi:hypothetical protein
MRTGFGPLLVASVGLLTVAFAGSASPEFGVGYAAGKLVTSLALGLPVFLLLKYATRSGRRLAGLEAMNLLCVVVASVWVLQLALPLVLPSAGPDKVAAEENLYAKFVQRPTPEPEQAGADVVNYRNPDGSTKWELFTPVEAASAARVVRSASGAAGATDPTTSDDCPRPADRTSAGMFADLVPPCKLGARPQQ